MSVDYCEKTAVFIGHSECYNLSRELVKKIIIKHINIGVINFLNGGQGEFDRLCAYCVYELQKKYANIKNYIVIPYISFSIFDKKIFDEIIFPDNFEKYYFKSAILERNKYMVENSSYAICYINHSWGGAAKTFKLALKRDLKIYNFGSMEQTDMRQCSL